MPEIIVTGRDTILMREGGVSIYFHCDIQELKEEVFAAEHAWKAKNNLYPPPEWDRETLTPR
jgi:hypothetical protein